MGVRDRLMVVGVRGVGVLFLRAMCMGSSGCSLVPKPDCKPAGPGLRPAISPAYSGLPVPVLRRAGCLWGGVCSTDLRLDTSTNGLKQVYTSPEAI